MSKIKKLKKWLKMLITNPNSAEGYRIRAERLIEQGYDPENIYVKYLLKRATLKEIENST